MPHLLPMLIIRTNHATAAVQLNGAIIGEASPGTHIALPLNGNGEYYIGIYPLVDNAARYFPVVRKIRFMNAAPLPPESGDVMLYAWPNSIYEAVFSPGALPLEKDICFPFTVDQLKLGERLYATLYYENGLKFAVEDGARILYGATLGDARSGRLIRQHNGLLLVLCGEPRLPQGESPEGHGSILIALNEHFEKLLHIECSSIGIRSEEELITFDRLPTQLGHDRKEIYRYADGVYAVEETEYGFFTHSPRAPQTHTQILCAFAEAVQYGMWEEALDYLSPGLRDGLDEETILACLGEFTGVRTLPAQRENTLGLLYAPQDGITPVRVFAFSFENGLIDNLYEEE